MLTVYTDNTFEYGPEWTWMLKAIHMRCEKYGFTFNNIVGIELLTPRQIYVLYGFITDEDMEYFVLITDTNYRIYVQNDPKNLFMSFAC